MSDNANDLREVLELTLQQTATKRRIDVIRARIDARAREQYVRDGAAPSWKIRGLGAVRLDGADATPTPYVADATEFGSWVAQNHPTEAAAAIALESEHLEAALEALEFAGVPVNGSAVAVKSSKWTEKLLGTLVVTDLWEGLGEDAPKPKERFAVSDVDGTCPDGIKAKAAGDPRLVVAPEAAAKAAALTAADEQLRTERLAAEQAEAVETGQAEAAEFVAKAQSENTDQTDVA